MIRCYSELSKLNSFEERFQYLKLSGNVGEDTFGFDRYLNQMFYKSKEWKAIRDHIIVRDSGCDLGILGYELYGKVIIHHMNPLSLYDLKKRNNLLTDPEYLITTTLETHNAIHYGDENILIRNGVERKPNDTCPWK